MRPRVWFNEDLESRNYIIPGLIAVIMMVIAAMLTSLTVAREWERGTMEQLISTPVKPGELILGKLVPYFAIGMCDVLLAVLMGEFVFHVPLRGNVALLFGMSSIFLIGALAMGMIDQHRHQEPTAVQPDGGGGHVPAGVLALGLHVHDRQHAAGRSRSVTYLVPARYFVAILKGIYLKGVGLEILGGQARVAGRLRRRHGVVGESEIEEEIDVIRPCVAAPETLTGY